jgi:lipopolysaccharide transport system ATP-binding protein
MTDIAIKVENLGKLYRIGQIVGYGTLRESLMNIAYAPFRRLRQPRDTNHEPSATSPQPNTIWALKDVSFEVKRGEAVGIIGRNGSGKTTILKILSRITAPTEGCAEIHGRVGSLLEVGTGFHPELTGRENIYLNGAVLGMKKAEVARKFDEIVAFSEIEKFLDTPVKRYSSGMYVRLAFAVAAHLEPEILVVDEVLAVGDAAFQKKCIGKMQSAAQAGRTVVFVSHNMTAVESFCDRVILLDNGYLMKDGRTNEVVASYLKSSANELLEQRWDDPQTAPGNENVRVIYAGIATEPGHDRHYLTIETPIELVFKVLNFRPDKLLHFSVHLHNQENICVFVAPSKPQALPEGVVQGICHIPAYLLNDNTYTTRLMVHFQGVYGVDVQNILIFEVHDAGREDWGWYGKWPGVVRPNLAWNVELLNCD